MSELQQIREELDTLRERITILEADSTLNMGGAARAKIVAGEADRKAEGFRRELRDGFAKVNADLVQITSLLTPEADAPARRPENTQSASDKPLT
jgi:hypothetical protein